MKTPLLFDPLEIRSLTIKNRIVVAPMHQYAAVKGFPTDWHLMNAGRFAAGGAGLVFIESTKVERRGCGTAGDLGLWDDKYVPHFRRLSDFIRLGDILQRPNDGLEVVQKSYVLVRNRLSIPLFYGNFYHVSFYAFLPTNSTRLHSLPNGDVFGGGCLDHGRCWNIRRSIVR